MEAYELLRKMRIDRGISQQKLSDKIISRNTLAKYEIGKNDIPFSVLLELLDKMYVSLDEFIFYLGEDNIRINNMNIKKLIKNFQEEKGSIKYALQNLSSKAKQTNDILHIRNYLVCKTYNWYKLDKNERKLNHKDTDYVSFVMNYLENINDWGRFELTTFTSLLFLFNTEYIKERIFEIKRKIEKNKDFEIFHSILSGMYNNAFLLMLERRELKLASYYLEEQKYIRHCSLFSFDTQIYFSFYELLLSHLKNGLNKKGEISNFLVALDTIGVSKLINELKFDIEKFENIYSISPNNKERDQDKMK